MTFSAILKTSLLTIGLASALGACNDAEVDADPSGLDHQRLQAAGYVHLGVAHQVAAPADLTVTAAQAPSAPAKAPSDEVKVPTSVLVLADGTMYEQQMPPADELQRLAALLEEANLFGQEIKDVAGAPVNPKSNEAYRLLGADGRTRVPASSLDDLPFRAIGRIGSGCSGALIGPRHVLTAAHCLHDDNGDWYWPLVFRPGVDGSTDINGPARNAVARRAYTGYGTNRDIDIGLIVLEDEASTAALGRFGFWYYDDTDTYVDRAVANRGYPAGGNTCGSSSVSCDGGMWGMACSIASASAGQFRHSCDTQGGHSGSPVYETINGSHRILGVHWGPAGSPAASTDTNAAARIRPTVSADLCEWMSWWPGTHGGMPSCAL